MTYDATERSTQGARRVDLYTFELPGVTYRLCSGSSDQMVGGNLYSAASISSSSIPLVPLGGQVREVTVSLKLNHELAIELRRGGIPPQNSLVVIRRMHIGDSETRIWWQGYIGSTRTDGVLVRMRVPNKIDLALACQLPAKVLERRCPYELGDAGCTVDLVAGGFRLTPTVSSVSGRTVVISSISGKPDGWANDGKIVRSADGEKRSIVSQIGTTLVVNFPFRTLSPGDVLEVFAGCDKSLRETNGCKAKFNNVVNFGGEPELPTDNPSIPSGLGIRSHL